VGVRREAARRWGALRWLSAFRFPLSAFRFPTSKKLLHRSEARAGSFADAHPVGQGDVAAEVEREGQHFLSFVGQVADAFQFGDAHLDAIFHGPVDVLGEGHKVARQDALEQLQALHFAVEGLEAAVVVLVEGDPVVEAVVEVRLPYLHVEVVEAHVFDAEGSAAVADLQRQVAVLQQVVDVVGSVVEAYDTCFPLYRLILDQRVAVVVAVGIAMVVEQGGGPPRPFDDGGPETGHFPRQHRGVELNTQIADLGHGSVLFVGVKQWA